MSVSALVFQLICYYSELLPEFSFTLSFFFFCPFIIWLFSVMFLFLVPTEGEVSFAHALKGLWARMHRIATCCRGTEGVIHLAVHLSFLLAFHPIETDVVLSCEDESSLASVAFFSDTTKRK